MRVNYCGSVKSILGRVGGEMNDCSSVKITVDVRNISWPSKQIVGQSK